MASTSFSLPNKLFPCRFTTNTPQSPITNLRVSASYANAERISTSSHAMAASCYDVLGLEVGATYQEIKSAYRKLARTLHPDVAAVKYGGGGQAAEEFIRVHAAYATLSDPEKRATYDDSLPWGSRRSVAVTSAAAAAYSAAAPRRRSWETDQCW